MASLRAHGRIGRPADDVWQVVADGADSAIAVYSSEITPDGLGGVLGPSIEGGRQGLTATSRGVPDVR